MGTILSWLLGGGISAIGKQLNAAYQAKLDAQNDADRIKADEQIAQLQAERDTILAAQSNRVGQLVRAAWATPFVVYNAKLVLWDKVMGLGITDPLSVNLTHIEMIVLGGYFLHATAARLRG